MIGSPGIVGEFLVGAGTALVIQAFIQAWLRPTYQEWRNEGKVRQFILIVILTVIGVWLASANLLFALGTWGEAQIVLVGADVAGLVVGFTVYLLILQMDTTRILVTRDKSAELIAELQATREAILALKNGIEGVEREVTTLRQAIENRIPAPSDPEPEDDG
jgi:hypothetical protein